MQFRQYSLLQLLGAAQLQPLSRSAPSASRSRRAPLPANCQGVTTKCLLSLLSVPYVTGHATSHEHCSSQPQAAVPYYVVRIHRSQRKSLLQQPPTTHAVV
ncbi:hypothetical protein COO60DRAFT_1554599 [Scenedesmus sp. NREL 46B-D3]|nr:hypothetical protein COO60DRAFT_1554599 [Scenedesmus sp. NREL 46B-D3]